MWDLAIEHECLLVTKDEDFLRSSVLRGAPPKVVWLRLGNCTTEVIAEVLRRHEEDLRVFASEVEASFLALGEDPPALRARSAIPPEFAARPRRRTGTSAQSRSLRKNPPNNLC